MSVDRSIMTHVIKVLPLVAALLLSACDDPFYDASEVQSRHLPAITKDSRVVYSKRVFAECALGIFEANQKYKLEELTIKDLETSSTVPIDGWHEISKLSEKADGTILNAFFFHADDCWTEKAKQVSGRKHFDDYFTIREGFFGHDGGSLVIYDQSKSVFVVLGI